MRRPDPKLLGGSVLLLVTLNLANALHFGFHMGMARRLGPEGYGALASLLSILYVLNLVAESIQTVLARYTAKEPDPGRLHDLLARSLRKGWRLAFGMALLYLALATPSARWLRIPLPLFLAFGASLIGVCLLPVLRGALQGRRRFAALGFNMVLEGAVKLGAGLALAGWGWGEYGAVAAVGLAFAAAYAAAFPPLRDLFGAKASPSGAGDIYRYSLPVLVVTATMMGFYSLDVLLARALFPAAEAGGYAIASFVGKTLLLGTAPIVKAMFPHASLAAEEGGGGSRRILAQGLGLLALCVVPAVAACALFPERILAIVGGKAYLWAAPLLPSLAAAMGLMAFSQCLLLYRLSTARLRGYALLPAWVVVEALVLYLGFRSGAAALARGVLWLNVAFLAGAAVQAAASSSGAFDSAQAPDRGDS